MACLLIAASLLPCCSPDEEEALRRMAPGLSNEMVRCLGQDGGNFVACAGEYGVEMLRESYVLLKESIPLDSPDAYREAADVVLPAMKKIAIVIDAEFGISSLLREYEILASAERGIPYRRLHAEQQEIYHDPELTNVEKLESLQRLLPQTEAPDMALLRPSLKYPISSLYAGLDDQANQMKYLREALSDARQTESYGWVCQLLGVLGSRYIATGDVDSVRACWDEALEIAERHQLAQQAARIASFYAWNYAGEGRLSLAHELFNEAQELCRKYKGGYFEIRYVLSAMEFQAELGCWEIVDRLYRRLRVLERQYMESAVERPNEDLKFIFSVLTTGADVFQARLLMEAGDVDKADQSYKSLRSTVREIRGRIGYPQFLFYWAEGLASNGRPHDAIPLIREGMFDAREKYLPWLAAEFALLGARTQLSEGRYDEALRFLDQFEELYEASGDDRKKRLRREWSLKEAVRARVYLASGDRETADEALESGLERLEASLAMLDKGAQGYLWLSGCAEFRWLLADLTVHDAALSYGAELYWRSLYRHLGGYEPGAASRLWSAGRADGTVSPSIYAHFASIAGETQSRIASEEKIHLLYAIDDEVIRRWEVDRSGIQVRVLDAQPDRLRDRVSRVWQELSADPGDTDAPIPHSLVEGLYSLARELLPEKLVVPSPANSGGHPAGGLLISGDGYLSKIPFEALNVGTNDQYTPLLERYDVAYLRHSGKRTVGASDSPGVILVTANIPPHLRDRYPLAGELTEALSEGNSVAALNPDALFLHGPAATKSNLMQGWKNAKFVYLAAHVLHDPEVPYLVLVPLSTPGERSGPDAAYLDISDIRSQPLDACEIVVLSGCSSGAPYLASRAAAPSLGDVFLDAGAGAVVQTFWAVADDYARQLMTSYVKTWESGGMPGVKGLADVRRAALYGPRGVRHPFGWASWSIKLGRF